jgi:hypothetical protein
MGAAVVLGQLASANAFAGVDSAAHMAEEVFISVYVCSWSPSAYPCLGQRRISYRPSYDDV